MYACMYVCMHAFMYVFILETVYTYNNICTHNLYCHVLTIYA